MTLARAPQDGREPTIASRGSSPSLRLPGRPGTSPWCWGNSGEGPSGANALPAVAAKWFLKTLIDPFAGYARTAPTQFRFVIGCQPDTQDHASFGSHDFTVDGLAGWSTFGTVIQEAHAIGNVAGAMGVGGFLGQADLESTVDRCYFDTDATGLIQGPGAGPAPGAIGRTTAELTGTANPGVHLGGIFSEPGLKSTVPIRCYPGP